MRSSTATSLQTTLLERECKLSWHVSTWRFIFVRVQPETNPQIHTHTCSHAPSDADPNTHVHTDTKTHTQAWQKGLSVQTDRFRLYKSANWPIFENLDHLICPIHRDPLMYVIMWALILNSNCQNGNQTCICPEAQVLCGSTMRDCFAAVNCHSGTQKQRHRALYSTSLTDSYFPFCAWNISPNPSRLTWHQQQWQKEGYMWSQFLRATVEKTGELQ